MLMKFLKLLMCAFFSLLAVLPLYAQNEYISANKNPEADCIYDLDGNSGVLILSKHQDLIIRVTNAAMGVDIKKLGKNIDGFYEFHVIINANDTREPKIEVSRRGSVYKTDFVQNLKKKDFLYAYSIVEVINPIRADDQTKGNDAIMDAKLGGVELISSVKGLKVKCHENLKATVTSKVNELDPNITIYNIVFPVEQLTNTKHKADSLAKEATILFDKLEKAKDGSKEKWDYQESLEKQAEELAHVYSLMSVITVYGDETNYILIDVSDVAPRMMKSYGILPLIVEKEIFVTECSSYMSEGARLFSKRKYKESKAAYTSALNSKDLVLDMKPAIMESISLCDTCMMYESFAARAIKNIIELKKQGSASQEEIIKYATAAVDFLEVVNKLNANEFYETRINTMKGLIDNLPLKIKFTIVEWKTLNEGIYIPGVEVWAFDGNHVITLNSFSTDKKFRRMVDDEKSAYAQLGVSDINGVVEIELDRKKLPKGIIFRPTDNDNVKIKYMPFTSLMQQAHGTYVEKQFRLKMFVK